MVEDLEPDIRAGSAACKEVISTKMFEGILRLILKIGNHMNFGSNIGGAVGFDLAVLTKLKDVKCTNNQKSLLHYIVEAVETKYPELSFFSHESSELLRKELKSNKYSQFIEAMSFFSIQSRQQVKEQTILLNQMKND